MPQGSNAERLRERGQMGSTCEWLGDFLVWTHPDALLEPTASLAGLFVPHLIRLHAAEFGWNVEAVHGEPIVATEKASCLAGVRSREIEK